MKKIIFIFLCLLMPGLVSASTFKLKPQALEGQKIIQRQGAEDVISSKKASILFRVMENTYRLKDQSTFIVGVNGGKEILFSTDNIKVFVDGKSHPILSPKEVAEEIHIKSKARVADAKDRYDAESDRVIQENMEKDPNDVGMTIGPPGGANRSAQVVGQSPKGTVVDSVAISDGQKEATETLQRELLEIKEETSEAIENLKKSALLKAKVPPNKWYLGQVYVAPISDDDVSHKIKVVVTVYGEKHEFSLDYLKVQ